MPNIIPITDLQNYDELLKVLSDTEGGDPVFLTKEGRGSYVILDINEFERLTATIKLMSELERGERSAREEGLIDFSEIEKEFADDV